MNCAVRNWGGLIALVLLTGCASIRSRTDVNKGEIVEAEGWAPVNPNDLAGTRERALTDAQKKAVEKVAGVFLAASTRIDAAIAVRDRITADVRGYIRRYKILDEKMEGGVCKIRIRAFVVGSNYSGGRSLTPNTPPPGSPMVRVVINDSGVGENLLGADAASAIENAGSLIGLDAADNLTAYLWKQR